MENFKELELFIKSNPDNWQKLLKQKPYSLKTVSQFRSNPDWYMLVYNLFESDLDNPIVKQCRGTCVEVDNGDVKIICAPYIKFFDINDPHADNLNWDSKKLKCQEKVDGQLQKMFKYNGRDFWVTNGGTSNDTPLYFATDEVPNYKELLKKCFNAKNAFISDDDFYLNDEWVDNIPNGWTLMFEITSPQNKIICEYSEYKAWFHGVRDENGFEHSPEEIKEKFRIPYDIPKRYNLSKKEDILAALEKFNGKEQEGFVVVDEETWKRVKMKSPSYLALKYIRDNDNPKSIWELCVSEQFDDFPDLKDKIDAQIEELNFFKNTLKIEMFKAIEIFKSMTDRKEFALYVSKNVSKRLQRFYFSAIDLKEEMSYYIDRFLKSLKEMNDTGYKKYCEILKEFA